MTYFPGSIISKFTLLSGSMSLQFSLQPRLLVEKYSRYIFVLLLFSNFSIHLCVGGVEINSRKLQDIHVYSLLFKELSDKFLGNMRILNIFIMNFITFVFVFNNLVIA